MYKLLVTKFVENDDYKEQMKAFNSPRYNYDREILAPPVKMIEQSHLEVIITDEEYAIIKKEVIKVS